jgi:hypothetical protein
MRKSTVLSLPLQLVFPDTANFARAVIYTHKMFMKFITGANFIITLMLRRCSSIEIS